MTPDETVQPGAETADTSEGGWTVESHSANPAPSPVDTTLEPVSRASAKPAPVADASREADAAEGKAFLDSGTMPATREVKPAAGAKAAKPKQSAQARIDELTGARRNAERERDEERAARTALEARIRALEAKPADRPSEKAVEKPAPMATDDATMPDPPRYVDFETDEEYNAAVKTYRAATVRWQEAREERLKASIATTIEERLARDTAMREAAARDAEIDGRLKAIHVHHPDFAELVAANADTFAQVKAPFLIDIITNTASGPELLYDLAKEPDLALALGALPLPSRPLADAVRDSPSAATLVKYFGSDEGREDFERLRQLRPITVLREIGKLEALLETAHASGPVSGVKRPITNAVPPAKPPVGSSRAPGSGSAGDSRQSFDDWMAAEDEREIAQRRQRIGATA